MPFKAGDKVVVVRGSSHFKIGDVLTVSRFDPDICPDHGGGVRLVGLLVEGSWHADRFKLAEEKPLEFAVGAQVERTWDDTNLLRKGQKYIIQTIYRDALGGVNKIKVEGINASYHVRGFKVVAKAKEFNREDWIPQVDEAVFITGKDVYPNGAHMDAYINNGVVYTIRRLQGSQIYLHDHPWIYLKESLTPVWATKGGDGKPYAPPPPPPPKELREALFKHQQERGLGNDLSSYAFETKDGKQHLYPYVCHARLSNEHGEIVKVAYGFRNDIARVPVVNREAHLVYSKYVINDSPWKDAFLTQDINEAVEKDILMNVEVNRFMMAGACVALRAGQEYTGRPALFKEMLDRGHNPHTCWLICCAFVDDGTGRYSFNAWGGAHDVIDKQRVFEDVIKFFQQGYHLEKSPGMYGGAPKFEPLTKDPYRTHHGSYAIANTIARQSADKENKDSIGVWFEKNTEKKTVGEGWDKKTVINVEALNDMATTLDKIIEGKA